MKRLFYCLAVLTIFSSCQNSSTMNNNFSPYPIVRQAYGEKIANIQQLLANKNIDTNTLNIFIRAFKTEQKLELWGKNVTDEKYQLVHTYDVCKKSGDLGPKRREGDYQVPEGA